MLYFFESIIDTESPHDRNIFTSCIHGKISFVLNPEGGESARETEQLSLGNIGTINS